MTSVSSGATFTIEAIERMASIAEFSLPNAPYHFKRIRGYTYVLAKGLGMDDAEAELLANASMLHDIGMVSVPGAVVMKTTNLTNEEWDVVKQHPLIGASLLEDSEHELFRRAKLFAVSHHERWDGSGYPHGLKGEAIPLEGRICGLCDVFDTLTHRRAYKPAMTTDEVLLLLQESSETFFEPELIDLFTLNFQKICTIRSEFQPPED